MKIKDVEDFINANRLLNKNDKLLIAVSGGLDSVALFDILYRLGYKITIAHCNFNLRANESIRDKEFVLNLSKKYAVDFRFIEFETINYASEQGKSIEMAARELRYNWFEEQRKEIQADYIVIAHHLDDSVETTLLNLTRGTGIKGVLGISPKLGRIVRPLLSFTRKEIESYAEENQLAFVTDSTNLESIYRRNSMRLDVIPLLKNLNPSVNYAIDSFSKKMIEVDKIYTFYINQQKESIFKNECINIPLLKETISPQTVLYEIMNPYGFSQTAIRNLFDVLDEESGKMFLSDNYVALKDRDYIYIKKKQNNTTDNKYVLDRNTLSIDNPIRLKIKEIDIGINDDIIFEIDKRICYIDASLIKYPLTLRKWQQGDRFTPFGMKGSKKLSDYFSDRKYSLFDKENAWVLVSDNKIVWIVGERMDDYYRFNSNTKRMLKIEYLE